MRRARQSTRGTRRSMPKPTLLYAWAVPVPALPFLDHTWVTSYDNRLSRILTTSKLPLLGRCTGIVGATFIAGEEPQTIPPGF
jgi:hypothetical protein